MRKKICKCGKIINENDLCCRKKEDQERTKRWNEENQEEARFLQSRRWRKLRLQILERDDYHCQRCLLKFGILQNENLECHHIKSRKNYPALRWETSNLITLCKTCNNQLGTSDKLDFHFEQKELEKDIYEYRLY